MKRQITDRRGGGGEAYLEPDPSSPPPLPWLARALDVIYGHAQRAPVAEAFHPASTGGSPHARLIWSSSCASSAAGWEDCGAAWGRRQQQGSSASSRPGRHGRGASMPRRACFRAVASVVHGHGRRGERGKWRWFGKVQREVFSPV